MNMFGIEESSILKVSGIKYDLLNDLLIIETDFYEDLL